MSKLKATSWPIWAAGIFCATAIVQIATTKPLICAEASSYEEEKFSAEDEAIVNSFIIGLEKRAKKADMPAGDVQSLVGDDIIIPVPGTNNFPTDPIDPGSDPIDPIDPDPIDPLDPYDPSYYPYARKSGASERLAMEVLYQTLNFYGVQHVVKKTGTRIDFKIVKSANGYFTSLTKLDIASSIKEFARYITAMLCNEPSAENFYKAFAQVPLEEIGLRFKYDMAWALMGNLLPREPNQIFQMGKRWTALQQIMSSVSSTQQPTERNKEVRSWMVTMNDIVKGVTGLNKMMCYVDIRPNAKEELKKRIVVKKFLEMEKRLNERYAEFKDIFDEATKAGKDAQLESLKRI